MKISILGDSISTYENYNPEGYVVFYDKKMQNKNNLNSVADTWWYKVIESLHSSLCSNNSYSGSQVVGIQGSSTNNINRLKKLQNNDSIPDLILVYIGCNDYLRGNKLKNKESTQKNISYFEDAYDVMLKNIKLLYPNSTVICGTLMESYIKEVSSFHFPKKYLGNTLLEYNLTIKKIAIDNNCYYADLNSIMKYDTLDGTHPTRLGHTELFNSWIECIKQLNSKYNIFNEETDLTNTSKKRY